ncbi:Photosynthetic NDH subunit of subcomplex B 2 [Nymphaea thermarum]|nr:Photosynthetic NDH subunit of subcomplex B 2 [Nymphaea thermarum]
MAASSSPLLSSSPPQLLEQKFGRKGVKFTQLNGIPTVELAVRNGSSLQLRLSDGLVTSYKPKVYWKDDGIEEMVYTVPDGSADGASVKGGIGLVLNNLSRTKRDGSTWSASQWDVKHVESDSIDAVQVELICTNADGALDVTYIVSLFAVSMATAVIVKNKGTSNAELTSGILSHLKFKGRKGSAVTGLTGCSYCAHPPLSSRFNILSQAEAMKPESAGWNLFSDDKGKQNDKWQVEDNKFVMMRDRFSRVYTAPPVERLKRIYNTPPSKYETIDQGNGLGFRIIRMGYDDIYLSCPGSFSERFGKDYFICTGPASMLVPVVLKPGEEWRGAQVLEHDNL